MRFSARVPVVMARSVSDDDSAVGLCYVLYDTLQHNKSIYNARVVSLRAESVVRAGQSLGGKMARCGSERRRGKNNVVRFLLKEANDGRAIANFEREFILPVLSTFSGINGASADRDNCLLLLLSISVLLFSFSVFTLF